MADKAVPLEPSSSAIQLDPPQHETLLLHHGRASTFPSIEHKSQRLAAERSFVGARIPRKATVEDENDDGGVYEDEDEDGNEIPQNELLHKETSETAHSNELVLDRRGRSHLQPHKLSDKTFTSPGNESWTLGKNNHAGRATTFHDDSHVKNHYLEPGGINRFSNTIHEEAIRTHENLMIPPRQPREFECTGENTRLPANEATISKHEHHPAPNYETPFPEQKVLATRYPDDFPNLSKTVYGRNVHSKNSYASSRRPYVFDYWSRGENSPKIEYEDEDNRCGSDTGSEISFDFIFSNKSPCTTGAEESVPEVSNQGFEADDGLQPKVSFAREVSHDVLRSNYINASNVSDISVDIGTTQCLDSISSYESSLFRWIHIQPPPNEDNCLDFETLIKSILHTPGLNQEEKSTIQRFLSDTRKSGETPLHTSQGQRGNYRDPSCVQWEKKKLTFFGMPYYSLEKYMSPDLLPRPTSYPARTILQLRFPSESKERDMQQAITFAPETPKDFCYHAPQIWSLIVDEKLLVTYASIEWSELCGEKVSVSAIPRPNIIKERYLKVEEPPCKVWMFPVDTCLTYFEFIAHFAENIHLRDNVNDHYVFSWRNIFLTPLNWTQVILQAQYQRTHIRALRLSDKSYERRSITQYLPNWNTERISRSRTKSSQRWGHESRSRSRSRARSSQQWTSFQTFDTNPLQIERVGDMSTTPGFGEGNKSNKLTPDLNSKEPANKKSESVDKFENPYPTMEKDFLPNNSYENNKILADHQVSEELLSDRKNQRILAFEIEEEDGGQTILPKSQISTKLTGKKNETVHFSEILSPSDRLLIIQSSKILNQTTHEREIEFSECCSNMKKYFHYFFPSEPDKGDLPDVKKSYKTLFSSFDSLWHFSRDAERNAFRYTSLLTRYQMKKLLSQKAKDGLLSFTALRFYRNAQDFFNFFAPINLNVPIFCKYWGAVYCIIDEENYYVKKLILPLFEDMAQCINDFRKLLLPHTAPKYLRLPDLFTSAWLHCLVSLTLCTYFTLARAEYHLVKADDYVLQGKLHVQRNMARKSLMLYQLASPHGVLLAIAHNLLQGAFKGQSDILQSYWKYFGQLRNNFQKAPLKRSHQQRFMYLRHEVETLYNISEFQRLIIEKLANTCTDVNEMNDPQTSMYKSCLECADVKVSGFSEIMQQIDILTTESSRMIESNKDRQEAAIYIFTIVTIVFLPLSFVSSVLGMNTSDIRNMGRSQWLFWAAAIPLTFSIIVICLLFTGDLFNLASWARQLLPQRSITQKYKGISSETERNNRYKASGITYMPTGRLRRKRTSMRALN